VALIYAPNTSTNWRLAYQDIRHATNGTVYNRKFTYSIKEWVIPVLFEAPILAVSCKSVAAAPGWQTGGWISRQERQTSLSEDLAILTDSSRRVGLHTSTLIDYTQLPQTSSYALKYKPPVWLQDVNLTIYEYTGPFDDTILDELGALKIDLLRIETKINALL
jgi:hypothetical protein